MKQIKHKRPSLKRLKRDARGISPIVATLMLVLITVAAAVAFYMFETGWQKTATSNVGDGTVSSTQLTMTGSTTVTDLMNTMVPAFQQNNSGFKVSYTGTGSGAGLLAIEKGTVDMGMISDPMNDVISGTTSAYPNLVATTIAYDGVSIFLAQATLTAHAITIVSGKSINMNQTIADAIYHKNVPTGGFTLAQLGNPATLPTGGVITTWADLEAVLVAQGSITVGTDSAASSPINVHFRSDSSGTQDAFSIKGLGLTTATKLGASGPGTGATGVGENGNPAMITDVMADTNGIGFATTGMVSQTTGAVTFTWNGVAPTYKTVIDSVQNYVPAGKTAATSQYSLWHPLIIVTNGVPATQTKSFIDWITAPDTNLKLCHAAGFTSAFESV
jgi:flagellin-like protein